MGRWAPAPDENCYGVGKLVFKSRDSFAHAIRLNLFIDPWS